MNFLKQFVAMVLAASTLVFAAPVPIMSGVETSTGITYSVAKDGTKYILVLRLPDSRKILTANVITAPEFDLGFKITKEPGAPASLPGLTREEIDSLLRFADNWKPLFGGEPAAMMMSLLGWLSEAPVNRNLDTAAGIGTNSSQSICNAGSTLATYDRNDGTIVSKQVSIPQCYNGDCFGRCGAGCTGPPGAFLQRVTQACANHDLCVKDGGDADGSCDDEFRAARGDLFRAPDCANVTGPWTDGYNDFQLLQKNVIFGISQAVTGTVIDIRTGNNQHCGIADVSGQHGPGAGVTLHSAGVGNCPPADLVLTCTDCFNMPGTFTRPDVPDPQAIRLYRGKTPTH